MSIGIVFDAILLMLILIIFWLLNSYWSDYPSYARIPVAAVGALVFGPLLVILFLLSPLLFIALYS